MLPNLSSELAPTTMLSRRMRGGYSDVYESSWRGKRVINHYSFLFRAEWSISYQVALKVVTPVNHLKSMRRVRIRPPSPRIGR
jgi:hypothetical protein